MKKFAYLFVLLIFSACNRSDNDSDAFGNFEAEEILISSECNGKIIELFLDEGQDCKKDKLACVIDTTSLFLKYKQSIVQISAAASRIAGLNSEKNVIQEQIRVLEKEEVRIKELIAGNAATQKQLDDITGQIDVLESKIKAIESNKNTAHAEMSARKISSRIIEDQLKKCAVRTPINGTVLETYIHQHELVAQGKVLFKIANLDVMTLRVYVDGTQLPTLKYGQEVRVFIDKTKEEKAEFKGKITWISDKAEFTPKIIQTREERVNLVYAVKISVRNEGSLKIGMPGEVIFN